MPRYVVARKAEEDIDEILAYISADNVEAAITFYGRLLDLFRMLAENPQAGRERIELQEGLRSLPEKDYLIFYRRWAGNIAIVRVLHSARDLEELFD